MRVAALTLTRDRLDYTKHCFATLEQNAGCEYDHYVFDQGSTDGTADWLFDTWLNNAPVDYEWDDEAGEMVPRCRHRRFAERRFENVGICPALNYLLGVTAERRYDVIVRFDNDCEVLQPDTLRTVCEVAYEYDAIVAPHVAKLRNPPAVIGHAQAGDHVIDETAILGGIFMAIPARLFTEEGFRYDERMPAYTGDEAVVPWWRARGGTAGYLRGWTVNHYERVEEQADVYPAYQQRKERELSLA